MVKKLPKFTAYIVVTCAFALIIAFGNTAQAQKSEQPGSAPVVTMKMWNSSSEQEQYAFLAGIVSMLELEKEWQGQHGLLPLKQSMIGSWGMGMDGMSLSTIRNAVNSYGINHPNDGDKVVLEVLWTEFVQPKLQRKVPSVDKKIKKRVDETMKSQK